MRELAAKPSVEFISATAFDELVAIHMEAAYRVAMAILRDPDEARDAVQDALHVLEGALNLVKRVGVGAHTLSVLSQTVGSRSHADSFRGSAKHDAGARGEKQLRVGRRDQGKSIDSIW